MCPLRLESQFPSGLRKAYNQIPLALKARVLGNFQSFCWIPRLGSLMWGSEPSQEYENFFGIIVLQSVGHPPGGYGISFIVLAPPPTISLGLPLCLWMWGTFFFFFLSSSILLSITVRQLVAVLMLSQEEMSARPSSLPS